MLGLGHLFEGLSGIYRLLALQRVVLHFHSLLFVNSCCTITYLSIKRTYLQEAMDRSILLGQPFLLLIKWVIDEQES